MKAADARRVAAAVALSELAAKNVDLDRVTITVDGERGISAAEAREAYESALDDARRAFHPEGPILSRVARALDFTPHRLHQVFSFLRKPVKWAYDHMKRAALAAANAVKSDREPRASDAALASAAAVTGKRHPVKDAALLPIRGVKGVLTWRPEDVKSKHDVELHLPDGTTEKMKIEVDDLALSIWLLRSSANACAIGGIPLPGSGAVSFLAAALASGALGVQRLRHGDLRGARACALTTTKVAALSAAIAGPILMAYQTHQDLMAAAHSGVLVSLLSDGLILSMANSLGTRLDEIELGSEEDAPLSLGSR